MTREHSTPSTVIPAQRPAEVYFYGTCLIDLLYPEAGLSAIELLEREGVRVRFPQEQTCCGQPPYNSGYRHEAITIAAKQVALFSESIPLVVPSASCAGMIKHHYTELLQGHPLHAQALDLSERTYEFSEFLNRVLKVQLKDQGAPVKVALHTSCSARREMQVGEDGMALLKQLDQVEVYEPERAQECCGFGGTFSVKQPEISAAMAEDKCKALNDTGASQVVSGDCGCLMNVGGVMEKSGRDMTTAHLATFLWQRTRSS